MSKDLYVSFFFLKMFPMWFILIYVLPSKCVQTTSQQLYSYYPVWRHHYCSYKFLQSYSHFLPDSILMLPLWSKLNRAPRDYIISLPRPFGAFSPYLEWKPKSVQRPTKPYDCGPHNVSSILLFAYWSSSLTCNWLLTLLGMLFSQILGWLTYSFT